VAYSIPIATTVINQHSPLDRLTPCSARKKKTQLNNKHRTEKEHAAEGAGCRKLTGEAGKSKELISA
jgi:hypothetical protein